MRSSVISLTALDHRQGSALRSYTIYIANNYHFVEIIIVFELYGQSLRIFLVTGRGESKANNIGLRVASY